MNASGYAVHSTVFGPAPISLPILLSLLLPFWGAGCAFSRGQQYRDFTTPAPLARNDTLVLGFLGGREPWNNQKRSVRKLALKLRAMQLPEVHVETVENRKRRLALRLVRNALDQNRDGQLDPEERQSVRLILYGQSFGGAAVLKLARELKALEVPVLLTVQVDSVGRHDAVIPSNVSCAANLFQRNGRLIRGQPRIRAEDPQRTKILGNFQYDYRHKEIDLSQVSWWKRVFRTAHTKMDNDPEVWARVEAMILYAIRTGGCSDPAAPK